MFETAHVEAAWSLTGIRRQCGGNEHCQAASPSTRRTVICLGIPDARLTIQCSLCRRYVCGVCAVRGPIRLVCGARALAAWRLQCPTCSIPLGSDPRQGVLIYSGGLGPIGLADDVDLHHPVLHVADDLAAAVAGEVDRHRHEAHGLLYAFSTAISVEGMMWMADRAVAAAPDEPVGWLYRAVMAAKAGYREASRQTRLALDDCLAGESGVLLSGQLAGALAEAVLKDGQLAWQDLGALKARLAEAEQALGTQRRLHLGEWAAQFDQQVQAFHSHRLPLAGYIEVLVGYLSNIPPEFDALLQASRLERTIDFPQTRREFEPFLRFLGDQIGQEALAPALMLAEELQHGGVSYVDFYRFLHDMVQANELDLVSAGFSALHDHLEYCALVGLDQMALMRGLWQATQGVYWGRGGEPAGKVAFLESGRLHLLKRLLDFVENNLAATRLPGTTPSNPAAIHYFRARIEAERRQRSAEERTPASDEAIPEDPEEGG